MVKCATCGGSLSYEPEILETPARYRCISCGWMITDPHFRKEQPRHFPPDRMDKQIEWQQHGIGRITVGVTIGQWIVPLGAGWVLAVLVPVGFAIVPVTRWWMR